MTQTPKIPTLSAATRYPSKNGRLIPENARKAMYEAFRAHTDEVREVLVSILRDEDADKGHRIAAGKEILSRGYGQAPSVEVIEAVFRHEHAFNADALRQWPQSKLDELQAMLAGLITVQGDTIDATPNESAEHAPTRRTRRT
jgi:hypothetical protein